MSKPFVSNPGTSQDAMMNTIDPVLTTPLSGRSHNLQSLIRHLIACRPSLIENLVSLSPSSIQHYAAADHAPESAGRGRTGKTRRTAWSTFPRLSVQKQETLLEDCAVFLFRRICANGKKTVLIHDGGSKLSNSRILQFCGPDIVAALRRSGFNSWFVDPSENNDLCLSLDKALLERMSFISLILVGPWGLSLEYNQETKTFKLPFSASLAPEWEDSILFHDYFYVPNHRTTDALLERYKSSIPLPSDQTKHRRTFTAVPIGNLKIYRIRKARHHMPPEERNKILFCAEAYDYANSVAKDYGILLSRKILERFPNNTFVYRPHPNWVNHPISQNIREAFADEHRFVFDTNASSETVMASGCALVTDGSLSGLTYCLGASRPAIFFNPSELSPHFDSNVVGFDFENGALFRFTSSLDETLEALEDLVPDPAKEFDEIVTLAEKAYAHPDDGLEYLLSSIHAIVENSTLSDWKCLALSEDQVGNNSAACYAGLMRNNLLRFPELYRLLAKDLSALDTQDDAVSNLLHKTRSHRFGHLMPIIKNFNALFSGMEAFGCSSTAIQMIDPLLEPILERGTQEEIGDAIIKVERVHRWLARDAKKDAHGLRLLEMFRSTTAGTIQSRIARKIKLTRPVSHQVLSLIAESWLAPRVPGGAISRLNVESNGACEIVFSCRHCGAQQSMNLQVWFSSDAVCASCGTKNHVDPFENVLHLPEAFFSHLPKEGEIVLWGAGGFYYKLMQKYKGLSKDRFLLADVKERQQGLIICGKIVHAPDIIVKHNIKAVIITALSRKDEICAYLRATYPSIEEIFAPDLDFRSPGIVPILKRL